MAKKKTVSKKKNVAKKSAQRKPRSKTPAKKNATKKSAAKKSTAKKTGRGKQKLKQAMAQTSNDALQYAVGKHVEPDNGNCLEGDLTIYNAAQLKGTFLSIVNASDNVEIDLSEISEIDTAGFQLMVMAKRECERLGKSIQYVNPSDAVREMLATYHAESLIRT